MELLHAAVVSLLLAPAGSPPGIAAMDSVTVTLRAPDTVVAGATVPVTLVVGNGGPEPVALYVTGRPPAVDLVVDDAEGRPVWRRLEGEALSLVLQVVRLEPGEEREFPVEWDQRDRRGRPVPPGSYRLRGALLTEGGASLTTAPRILRIEPGEGGRLPGI